MDDLANALKASDELNAAARESLIGPASIDLLPPGGPLQRMEHPVPPVALATCETCGVAVVSLRQHAEWHRSIGDDEAPLTAEEVQALLKDLARVLRDSLSPNYEIRAEDYAAAAKALYDELEPGVGSPT